MNVLRRLEEEAELCRLTRSKRVNRREISSISDELVSFYRSEVKRAKKVGGVAEVWKQLLPQHLLEHTCIEAFRGGALTVLVDSSPHLFQLKQLLLAGLQSQLITSCRGCGLKKILLKPGAWYAGDTSADRTMVFGG